MNVKLQNILVASSDNTRAVALANEVGGKRECLIDQVNVVGDADGSFDEYGPLWKRGMNVPPATCL